MTTNRATPIEKIPTPASIEGDVAYDLVEKVNEMIDVLNHLLRDSPPVPKNDPA